MSDNIYCYPDSTVLKNKLNITDSTELAKMEENGRRRSHGAKRAGADPAGGGHPAKSPSAPADL